MLVAREEMNLFDFDWSKPASIKQNKGPKVIVKKLEEYEKLPEGGMTFEEIGEALGISRQRAQKICEVALKKMRNYMKNSHNRYFSDMVF